jgi:RNA polymerase sigma-70 factor (ECF subfamily)
MATDFETLEAWRAGDEQAGRDLFGRHFDGVYRFFRNKVADAAEDLTQQTFMACVQGRDRFRGESSFRTYLFTIARKRLYSYLRENRQRTDPLEFRSTSIEDLGLQSPSRAVSVREEQRLLLRGLRSLPIDMQVALELFYWEELTVSEIGEVLDVPVGTVKSRLQRARARLDTIIAELADSDALRRSTVDDFERWARDLQSHMSPEHSGDVEPE